MTEHYVLGLEETDKTQVALVGGKGANLGELSRIEGIRVPAGFCVTTDAFRRVTAAVPELDGWLGRLSRLEAGDREAIRALSSQIRRVIEGIVIPEDVTEAITGSVSRLGERAACAVRSSATAEDSPTASFAGQQDTYLNVVGPSAILEHVRRCWASLFTERAVTYRLRNGFDHRKAHMAVVVQEMVAARAAGVLFTADPVTSNRKVTHVEAGFGLGEALVSGMVSPDAYQVRDGEVTTVTSPGAVLADAQVTELARLGRRIEAHFGQPQDIEWCLDDDGFQFVQSRPITTLFPLPEADDGENHVYLSVGHQQMMTDPMKPLGLSFWQMTTPRAMSEAGGRLFVDVARQLGAPKSRSNLLAVIGRSDPLMGDALATLVERGDFIADVPEEESPYSVHAVREPVPIETDPATVVELIERGQASVAALNHDIRAKSGQELLDFIQADIGELRRVLFAPDSTQVIMAGIQSVWQLGDRLGEWLGEKNAVDPLTQSVPHNVTSEMGLALLDVADAIRPHPDVVAFLENGVDDDFLEELPSLAGGKEARDAIDAYLSKYGMRCVGEIDLTKPRWSERPDALVPMILANVRNCEPGERERRFDQGRRNALASERSILRRLRSLPDGGTEKAEEAKRLIDRIRTFIGYREYPKYNMVSRYFLYKRALLEEAGRLVRAGVLQDREDIFYLRFSELPEILRTNQVDQQIIRDRKDAYRSYLTLTPPRVHTSDGEVITGRYQRADIPAGALVGLPVSAGTVEGRARVIRDMAEANLEEGDILVTAYTDPSWTPAFVAIKGLVTEVGGQMTHGAVIAREYGLPAVVGVENATRLIPDGQRIRLHASSGYIELLPATP